MNREQRRRKQKKNRKKGKVVHSQSKSGLQKMEEKVIINRALKQYEDKYLEAYNRGSRDAADALFAALAMALHDNCGWGQKRVKRLFEQVTETFDAVQHDYVSIGDLKDTVKDELAIDIK